jgi:hypothetical protein
MLCLLVQVGGVDIIGRAASIDLQEKLYLSRDILDYSDDVEGTSIFNLEPVVPP